MAVERTGARRALAAYRLLFAGLALTAVLWQLVSWLDEPDFSVVQFFSFFTIESNLFAAAVLLASGLAVLRGRGTEGRLDSWRGAAVLYMTTTGAGYYLLLSGTDDGDGLIAWVNAVVHYAMPLALLADWVLDPPRRPIDPGQAVAWMAFPTAFVAYSMLRGLVVDWHPYPFLDPDEHGYPGVTIAAALIGLGMLGLGWLLARSPRWLAGRAAVRQPAR